MTKEGDLRVEAALATQRANELGLTQAAIAEAIGASQSQVSRVLSGAGVRRSRLFDQVCKYVFSTTESKTDVWQSADLTSALEDVWDGTPAHARALALVIRSLSALSAPVPAEGRPHRKRAGRQ